MPWICAEPHRGGSRKPHKPYPAEGDHYYEVLIDVQSLLSTGGSTSAPEEWIDFQIMKRMNWTWNELEACPAYVRNYVIDFLQMEDEARAKPAPKGEVFEHNVDAWHEAHNA
jgi:hypothetical protein